MTFGIIGVGNMGEAILRGFVASQNAGDTKILIFDLDSKKCRKLEQELHVQTAQDLLQLIERSDIILLAIKPNVCSQLLSEDAALFEGKALISIVAGWGGEKLRAALPKSTRILRVMPNTPAMICEGMIVFEDGDTLHDDERAFAETLFLSVGEVTTLDAHFMDAVTAVSGSGPAYVYLFIEALADGGVKAGLPRQVALQLAAQTVKGSAMMVLETETHPGELKDRVCSPGGTTIDAVATLEQHAFRGTIIAAVDACFEKSQKMSK